MSSDRFAQSHGCRRTSYDEERLSSLSRLAALILGWLYEKHRGLIGGVVV